jgi:hypothetical protein
MSRKHLHNLHYLHQIQIELKMKKSVVVVVLLSPLSLRKSRREIDGLPIIPILLAELASNKLDNFEVLKSGSRKLQSQ